MYQKCSITFTDCFHKHTSAAVASPNDWGPLDILILGGPFTMSPVTLMSVLMQGFNARPEGMRAVLHTIIEGFLDYTKRGTLAEVPKALRIESPS